MSLDNCSCLPEYERNLLISALASHKAEINKMLGSLPREKISVADAFVALSLKRVQHIDQLIKKIEDTPTCEEWEMEKEPSPEWEAMTGQEKRSALTKAMRRCIMPSLLKQSRK